MKILFEDEFIIVCLKPVGIISQADSSGKESMISKLKEHTATEIFPLHRLDREVGGVMVFAKTKKAAAILSTDIANHKFKKEYIALVHGAPEQNIGQMRDLLFKDSRKNKSYVVNRMRKGVKEAVLDYEVVETKEIENEKFSLVKILLHTGRTHQIRVQFSWRKMPLAGDRKYGGKDGFNNIRLWSYSISFNHPKTGEELSFCYEPEWDYIMENQ